MSVSEAGRKLLDPPSSVDEILSLLDVSSFTIFVFLSLLRICAMLFLLAIQKFQSVKDEAFLFNSSFRKLPQLISSCKNVKFWFFIC